LEYDDPEFIALRKYGAVITDNTGRLKDFKDMTEEVYQAWKKADKAGEGIEFLQMLGGESGVRDAIQYFKRFEEAKEDAEKVFDAGLDPEEMHKNQRSLNLLTMQIDEFKDAAVNIITPATIPLVDMFFNALNSGTEILVGLKDALNGSAMGWIHFKKAFGFDLTEQEEQIEKIAEALGKTNKEKRKAKDFDPLNQYSEQRKANLKDAIADLRVEIDYENEYQQAVKNAQLEKERALRLNYISTQERAVIEKKYLTEIEKAEKEHKDELEDIWKETNSIQYEISHSAYEKEIYDIETWKQKALDDLGEYKDAIGDKNKWLKESAAITAQAAAKEAQAFEKEVDKIKGKFQSLEEKIFEMQHSQHENDVMKVRKEAQEMLDEGLDPERVAKYIALAIAKINAESREDSDRLKRPDYQLVNPPDFSEYDQMQAQIEADVEKYKADLNNQKNGAKDAAQKDLANIDKELSSSIQAASDSVKKLNLSVTNINGAFITAGDSAHNLANSLKNVSDQINNTKINQPTTNGQTPNSAKSDSDNKSDNKPDNKPASKNDNINFADFNSRLAELTKTVGSIAQEVTKKNTQPPQVNVNPNISLNLSGSYVLTQEMVNQLAYDCTTEVANGVTDAVSKALNNIRL
jgi:hypothetical protein